MSTLEDDAAVSVAAMIEARHEIKRLRDVNAQLAAGLLAHDKWLADAIEGRKRSRAGAGGDPITKARAIDALAYYEAVRAKLPPELLLLARRVEGEHAARHDLTEDAQREYDRREKRDSAEGREAGSVQRDERGH